MKTINLFLVIIICFIYNNLAQISAQTVMITEDSSYIGENSAILDVKSNNKGFLPPRLTTMERQSISNPANGLIVYDTDANMTFQYNGTTWNELVNNEVIDSLKKQIIDLQIMTGILVQDYDGNIYKTVKIGTKRWMAENMRTTSFPNGNPITHITDSSLWANETDAAYCWYNNDSVNYSIYGALYTWDAAKSICPQGWHLPTSLEWDTFFISLGGLNIAGGLLKETGLSHWSTPNTGATNSTGFTALPSGARGMDGSFISLFTHAFFYTSTFDYLMYYQPEAFFLSYDTSSVTNLTLPENTGASVRCVKD